MIDSSERRIGVCVDINLSGEDLEASERIRERVSQRLPRRGLLHYHDENRRSYLIGGEKTLLLKIANRYLNGDNIDIDGIFIGGINVAGVVDFIEYRRILSLPEVYRITASFDYLTQTSLILPPKTN